MTSRLFGFSLRPSQSGTAPVRPRLNVEALEERAVPAVIAGAVYNDLNNNGVRDPGELGIAGSTIQLNGLEGHVLATATTDATGHYQFTLPSAGERSAEDALRLQEGFRYTVSQPEPLPGYLGGKLTDDNVRALFSPACSRRIVVDADAAGQTNLNFGELKPASLAGSVTVAGDHGASGVPGAVVNLTGTDDKGESVTLSRTTGADGFYLFDGLRPGAYGSKLILPPGYDAGQSLVGSLRGLAMTNGVAGIGVLPGAAGSGYDFTVMRTSAAGAGVPANDSATQEVATPPSGGTGAMSPDPFEEFLLSFRRNLDAMNWPAWGS